MVKVDEHKLQEIVLRINRVWELAILHDQPDVKEEAHKVILLIGGLNERKKTQD